MLAPTISLQAQCASAALNSAKARVQPAMMKQIQLAIRATRLSYLVVVVVNELAIGGLIRHQSLQSRLRHSGVLNRYMG